MSLQSPLRRSLRSESDDRGEAFFELGEEGVEVDEDEGEEEEGVGIEAAGEDGPQEETGEGGGDAAGDDCSGDVGEEIEQPAAEEGAVEEACEEGDLAHLLGAVYHSFLPLLVIHSYYLKITNTPSHPIHRKHLHHSSGSLRMHSGWMACIITLDEYTLRDSSSGHRAGGFPAGPRDSFQCGAGQTQALLPLLQPHQRTAPGR